MFTLRLTVFILVLPSPVIGDVNFKNFYSISIKKEDHNAMLIWTALTLISIKQNDLHMNTIRTMKNLIQTKLLVSV